MSSVLEDKDAIRELLANYCFHVDGGDFDKWAGLFTEDATFDVGPLGKVQGREAIRKFVGTRNTAGQPTPYKHCTINSVIRVNGNEAHAESYIFVLNGGEHAITTSVAGRYEDLLVKQGDQWRFRARKVHLDIAPTPR
jgi:uncharacterized protein (TIGR02246 family)